MEKTENMNSLISQLGRAKTEEEKKEIRNEMSKLGKATAISNHKINMVYRQRERDCWSW